MTVRKSQPVYGIGIVCKSSSSHVHDSCALEHKLHTACINTSIGESCTPGANTHEHTIPSDHNGSRRPSCIPCSVMEKQQPLHTKTCTHRQPEQMSPINQPMQHHIHSDSPLLHKLSCTPHLDLRWLRYQTCSANCHNWRLPWPYIELHTAINKEWSDTTVVSASTMTTTSLTGT